MSDWASIHLTTDELIEAFSLTRFRNCEPLISAMCSASLLIEEELESFVFTIRPNSLKARVQLDLRRIAHFTMLELFR